MAIKKQSFVKGVFIIMIAQILIKILGFVYRVVLTNIKEFSDLGNSYYGSGFSVYAFILAIATMGIPNTISKLVSEKIAIGDRRGAHKIFKVALGLFTFIGAIFALILFFGSSFIATNILNNPGVKLTLMTLAPAVIFVSMTAVIRGYFVGMQNMTEYSKAQVLEQIVNSVFSIVFVYMLIDKSPEVMAAGSTFATTLSTFASFVYLFKYYNKNKKDIWKEIKNSKIYNEVSSKKIAKKLIAYAIPISFGSVIVTLSALIDTITVVDGLQKFKYTLEEANVIYGSLVGKVEILNALPLSINVAFAVALVPFISSAMANKKKKEAVNKINFSLKTSGFIAFPCAIGLSLMADGIFSLLFPNALSGAYLLKIQAFVIIFAVIAQTIYGSLQGIGKLYVPGICLGIGVFVKYILNVIFIPKYGEIVAPISTIIYQFIACTFSFILLFKYLKITPNVKELFLNTIKSTFVMGIVIFVLKNVIYNIIVSKNLATIIIIIAAIITYLICTIIFRTFSKEELKSLPAGDKIYKLVSKFIKY